MSLLYCLPFSPVRYSRLGERERERDRDEQKVKKLLSTFSWGLVDVVLRFSWFVSEGHAYTAAFVVGIQSS